MSQKNRSQKEKNDSDKAKIRELTKENLRLQREISTLKAELERGKPSSRRLLRKRDNIRSTFAYQARRQDTYSQESFLSYFFKAFKNASFFRIYSDIINTVRHFTFVTTTIQIVLFLLAIVKSGAIFLISTSAFIVALPFIFIISGIGAILTVLGSKKASAANRPMMKNKDVYVFFPAKKSAIRSDSFFAGFVRSTANESPDRVCVIVSHGFFFSRGIFERKRYYFTSRKEAENIIIVRKHYYFKLKNKIIIPEAKSINEIY
jgi:hypothetical protein